MPWRRRRVGQAARPRPSVASGASSPPAAGGTRPRRRRRRPGAGPARRDARRRSSRRRGAGGRVVSSAHSTTAPARQVAAQARRAAHDLARLEVGPRAQVLQERAAQVLLDLLLGLLDGDLGQRGDGREVQELGGVRGRLGPPPRSSSTAPTTSSPDAIGTSAGSAGRHRRPAGRCTRSRDVAAQRPRACRLRGRRRPRATTAAPSRGTTIATGAAGRLGGQRGHALQAVAAQHGVDHPQVDRAQALDQRAGGRGGGRRSSGCSRRVVPARAPGAAQRAAAVAAASGWAWRISSPDSPVRTR